MNGKQAKKISRIIGTTSEKPSKRLYRNVKKIFSRTPHNLKRNFLKNLEQVLKYENKITAPTTH